MVDGVAADGFRSGFQALRRGGTLVAIGMSAVLARGGGILGMGWAIVQLGLRHLWPDGRRGTFYSITSYRAKHRDHWTADLTEFLGWLERGHIGPVVGERMMEQARVFQSQLDAVLGVHQVGEASPAMARRTAGALAAMALLRGLAKMLVDGALGERTPEEAERLAWEVTGVLGDGLGG